MDAWKISVGRYGWNGTSARISWMALGNAVVGDCGGRISPGHVVARRQALARPEEQFPDLDSNDGEQYDDRTTKNPGEDFPRQVPRRASGASNGRPAGRT